MLQEGEATFDQNMRGRFRLDRLLNDITRAYSSAPRPAGYSQLRTVTQAFSAGEASQRSQPWSLCSAGPPLSCWRRSFTTAAEDYDLITAESGIVRIEGYNPTGFIVNDVAVEGPLLCMGDLYTMWAVESLSDVTPQTLSMLHLTKPAPDLLILGTGLKSQPILPELQRWLIGLGMSYEASDTINAVATFNILNQEGRKVAGAFLPAA